MEAGSGQGAGQRGSPMMAASTSSAMEDTKLKPLPPSNGPRPHRCEVCQRSFREVATLRKHEQLHRADRPYVCNTCGKSFLWSSNLKVHERVHTGERPYKCKICHRCFTQSNDLRRHERNVHMRGKIYGYKSSGRHSSQPGSQQVNLAAYQAFAMQQRALLQQALTYESYLQKAAAGSGQSAAQLYHHTQGMGGAGTASMVGQRPPDPASSPRSPLKLEQSDGLELPHSRAGTLPSFSSFRPMQRPMEGLSSLPLGSRHHLPSGHRAQPHLGEGQSLPHPNLRLTQEMINFHHQHLNNNNSSSTNHNNGESRHTPPQPTSQGMTDGRDKDIDPQGRRSRERDDYRRLSRGEEESREYDRESDREIDVPSRREEGSGRGYGREGSIEVKREASEGQTSPCDYHQPVHKHRLREILESQSAAPAHTIEDDHRKVPSSYPCDSVMDLSMNKSSHSPPSRASSAASSTVDKEVSAVAAMPPPKTPTSVGAESESEPGKRDVTTTSATPTADSGGIHHCQHCNIFFYDYTMFHLHESLHMPYEDHPFRCPSCGTHCQDKIEFMFHTVWHVKYPHTIPNYTPFREGFLSSP